MIPESSGFVVAPAPCLVQTFVGTSSRSSVRKRLRPIPVTRACLPSNPDAPTQLSSSRDTASDGGAAGSAPAKTKTEQIAELLGQSKETMTESRNKVMEQQAQDNRNKYGLALLSTVVAVAFFLAEKLDPSAGVNLLRFLEESSPSPSVVGTNDIPTFIEFGATWCENCKLMAKSIFELKNEYTGRVNFLVLDGDDPKNAEIIERFGVDGIPQFSMVTRDGSVRANLIGRVPKEVLAQDLDALLAGKDVPYPGILLEDLRQASS